MEIDITDFFNNAAPMDYAASIAEIGDTAGEDTWRAACDDSASYPLLDTDDKREEFRRYIKSLGAWPEEEIAKWSDSELNALCIQFVAGDIREAGLEPDCTAESWDHYRTRQEAGKVSGSLYRGDDGRVYYSIGM